MDPPTSCRDIDLQFHTTTAFRNPSLGAQRGHYMTAHLQIGVNHCWSLSCMARHKALQEIIDDLKRWGSRRRNSEIGKLGTPGRMILPKMDGLIEPKNGARYVGQISLTFMYQYSKWMAYDKLWLPRDIPTPLPCRLKDKEIGSLSPGRTPGMHVYLEVPWWHQWYQWHQWHQWYHATNQKVWEQMDSLVLFVLFRLLYPHVEAWFCLDTWFRMV